MSGLRKVFAVHAYEAGDRERRSYQVGVYSSVKRALKAATAEQSYTGTFQCEVIEWTINHGIAGGEDNAPARVIKDIEPEAL